MSFYAWNFACSPAVGYNDPLSVENLAMARLLLGNMSIRDSGILYWTDSSYVAQVGSLSNPFDGLFEPADAGGGVVSVQSGAAIVNGYLFISDAEANFDINGNPGNANATDRIVIRWTAATQDVSLTRVNGAAGNTAALTQTSAVWDIPVARVELDGLGEFSALIDDRRLAMATGTWIKIDEQNGGASPITFSGIPRLFSQLKVFGVVRSDVNVDGMTMILNGDAGANYNYHDMQIVGTGSPPPLFSAGANLGANSIAMGNVTGAADADFMSGIEITIYGANKDNCNKTITANCQNYTGSTLTIEMSNVNGWYDSLDPINEIELALVNGAFETESTIYLYGII